MLNPAAPQGPHTLSIAEDLKIANNEAEAVEATLGRLYQAHKKLTEESEQLKERAEKRAEKAEKKASDRLTKLHGLSHELMNQNGLTVQERNARDRILTDFNL